MFAQRRRKLTVARKDGPIPMRASDLKRYKAVLLAKRQDLLNVPTRSTVVDEALRTGDWVDHSSQENDLHVNLALNQTDTKLQIENGTFGICMDCEEEI